MRDARAGQREVFHQIESRAGNQRFQVQAGAGKNRRAALNGVAAVNGAAKGLIVLDRDPTLFDLRNAGVGVGIGQGIAAGKAAEAVGRNPEAESKIRTMMIVGIALTETSVIYSLIIAILLIFVFV